MKDQTWYEESDIPNIHNPTNYQSNYLFQSLQHSHVFVCNRCKSTLQQREMNITTTESYGIRYLYAIPLYGTMMVNNINYA
jgi:hypothetical protein